MEALGEPCGCLGCAGSGLGGVLGGAGALLGAYRARLRRSLGRLGAILGALEAMLRPPGGQKARVVFGIDFEIDFGRILGTPKS